MNWKKIQGLKDDEEFESGDYFIIGLYIIGLILASPLWAIPYLIGRLVAGEK